ncbi:polymorphic outer membrane protein middle domain-containing protein [Chlamydiifrater volucris]|uniref:polymorphic outer membrane protein middle domain-containing protein n=1 Tax=Chlamydiifrater volucris TaxID=2681470 RepID=UPI0032B1AC19
MRKRQSLYLVALTLLTNLATCQGSALPDNASLIENAFDTVEKDGVTIHTMNRDFTVSSFVETILSPYHLMMTPNKVLFQGNDHNFSLSYLNLANQLDETQTSNDITFQNFKELKIDDSAGFSYILKADNINFLNNKFLSVSRNQVPANPREAWGGCILSKCFKVSQNNSVIFSGNMIQETGAVVKADNILDISKNNLVIVSDNFGKKGALAVTPNSETSKTKFHFNNVLILSNNNSYASEDLGIEYDLGGGAIYQRGGIFSIHGNKAVVFYKNVSAFNGGAIACDNLDLSKNSMVLFLNNTSISGGGAIYFHNKNNGNLQLSADCGDVIFHGNTQGLRRNAISFQDSRQTNFDYVRSKKNCKVHFNDPIDFTNSSDSSAQAVRFNPKDSSSPNSGKIVFSLLGKASKDESPDGTSKIPKIRQEDGVVVIKDGATLATRTFSQTGGWLILGAKGSFGTYATTGSNGGVASITLSNLAIDISSLLPTTQVVSTDTPTLVVDNETSGDNGSANTISVSGPIYLTDENLSLYEYDNRMASSADSIKLLELKKANNSTSKINVDDVELTTQPSHYGYQGSWHLSWEDTTVSELESRNGETIQSCLVGSWIPNGQYLPNPKVEGKFLLNSLIASNFAITSFFESIYQQDRNDLHFLCSFKEQKWKYNFQGNFISSMHSSSKKRPFHHKFLGFSVSASAYSSLNNQLGVAISKISCQTDQKDFDHQVCSPLSSAAFFSSFYPQKSFLTEIRGVLSVSKSNNTFKNNEYKVIDLPKEVLPYCEMIKKDGIFLSQDENKTIIVPSAKFCSHTFSTQWDFFLEPVPCKIFGTPILIQLFPFCSIQAFLSDFSNFENTETTRYNRSFKQKCSATHLFLPVGARLNIPFQFLGNFTQTKASFSYIPLAYKKNLILKGSLTELSDASWETSNSNFPRNSAKCILAQEITFKDAVKINASYSLHYIYSSFLQSANVGIQTIF